MVNVGDLFAGAAVGGAFGPVFDVFREVVEKTVAFNPTLKSVKTTVDSLALLIPLIEDHNQKLGGNRQGEVKELKEKMEEGKKLIEELLEVNEWNCLKAHYTDQLVDLDESLKLLLEILQVQEVIDVKEGLALTKDISKDAKEGLALTKEVLALLKETFDISKDAKEGLALTKDISKDAKEGLALTKDISKDAKEGLALTKDISTNATEGLALTKDISKDAKEGLALLKKILALSEENRNQVVGFDDTLKAGLSDIQKFQEVMFQRLMRKLERNGMANKGDGEQESQADDYGEEEVQDSLQDVEHESNAAEDESNDSKKRLRPRKKKNGRTGKQGGRKYSTLLGQAMEAAINFAPDGEQESQDDDYGEDTTQDVEHESNAAEDESNYSKKRLRPGKKNIDSKGKQGGRKYSTLLGQAMKVAINFDRDGEQESQDNDYSEEEVHDCPQDSENELDELNRRPLIDQNVHDNAYIFQDVDQESGAIEKESTDSKERLRLHKKSPSSRIRAGPRARRTRPVS